MSDENFEIPYTFPQKHFEIPYIFPLKHFEISLYLYNFELKIKSLGYATHASLDTFMKKFSSRIANDYLK